MEMNIGVVVNEIDIILALGMMCGIVTVGIYNPMMYGCEHLSKKFLLGLVLIVVALAGLFK